MYSSVNFPSESNHYNYHSNAFNALATAKINKTCATATKSTSLQATTDNNIIVRSSSSDDAHQKQFKHSSPSIFDENNICSVNKFSHGAYESTYSHNIFDNAKHRNQLFNERL